MPERKRQKVVMVAADGRYHTMLSQMVPDGIRYFHHTYTSGRMSSRQNSKMGSNSSLRLAFIDIRFLFLERCLEISTCMYLYYCCPLNISRIRQPFVSYYIGYNDNNELLLPFSADVLMPITCGGGGKHQWCWVLNTMQYVADMESTCCLKRVVPSKASNSYLIRELAPSKTIGCCLFKRCSVWERMLFNLYQTAIYLFHLLPCHIPVFKPVFCHSSLSHHPCNPLHSFFIKLAD